MRVVLTPDTIKGTPGTGLVGADLVVAWTSRPCPAEPRPAWPWPRAAGFFVAEMSGAYELDADQVQRAGHAGPSSLVDLAGSSERAMDGAGPDAPPHRRPGDVDHLTSRS